MKILNFLLANHKKDNIFNYFIWLNAFPSQIIYFLKTAI